MSMTERTGNNVTGVSKDIRRIAIILCYDKDGIIDDYVLYLLHDLNENLTDLVVTVNGKLSPSGRERLQTVTDKIYIRENKGADAGAWKDTMLHFLGWSKLYEYDEIVLLNDSFYGPFYPFREVFAEMETRPVDFWGLLAHGETNVAFPDCPYPNLLAHIQSYFMVFRKRMHTSPEFKKYWEEMPYFATVQEAISRHETVFTRYFSELGYRWDTFVDVRDLDGEYSDGQATAYCFLNTYELIRNRCFPVLKRHCFGFSYQNHLASSHGMHLRQSMAYIAEHTEYDVQMIYQNIIRLYNITDIFYNLQLNFVLPKNLRVRGGGADGKAVMVYHNEYLASLKYIKPFLLDLPPSVAVLVTVGSGSDVAAVEKCFRKELGPRLRVVSAQSAKGELSAFLTLAAPYLMDYEYIGFCHDAKSDSEEVIMVGESLQELMAENVAGSRTYVENVLELFRQRPELGLLCVPSPHYAKYTFDFLNYWQEDFASVRELLGKLRVQVGLAKDRPPLMTEMAFWCRREAIETLLNNASLVENYLLEPVTGKVKKPGALKKMFPYIAQHHGFLTGWIVNDDYARTEFNNINYILGGINSGSDSESDSAFTFLKIIIINYLKKHLPEPLIGPAKKVKHLLHL